MSRWQRGRRGRSDGQGGRWRDDVGAKENAEAVDFCGGLKDAFGDHQDGRAGEVKHKEVWGLAHLMKGSPLVFGMKF